MIKKQIDKELENLKLFASCLDKVESKDLESHYKLARFVRMKRQANSFYRALLAVRQDFKDE